MPAESELIVEIDIKWWVMPYIKTLVVFCWLFGTVPDLERVGSFVIDHGVKIRARVV